MSDLAISPEELAEVLGTSVEELVSKPKPSPAQTAPAPQPQLPTVNLPDLSVPKQETRPITAHPVQFAPLQSQKVTASATNLDVLLGVTLQVTVELGRTKMNIQEILQLGPGSVIELDKLAGEPVDVLVNNRLIARGEVVVIDDRFGVRITDVLPPAQRVNSL
jgi:flagellar motor switch protein FliN/FliY